MRVLVCGGRDYSNRDYIWNTLCDIDEQRGPITCVIHGCQTGADSEGMIWAQTCGRLHAPFEPDWYDMSEPCIRRVRRNGQEYNALAGPKRNTRMLVEGKPDLVVAFPGGKGTADMVRQARKAGVEVIKIKDGD
jgi:hypothetical protein